MENFFRLRNHTLDSLIQGSHTQVMNISHITKSIKAMHAAIWLPVPMFARVVKLPVPQRGLEEFFLIQ